MNPKFRNLDFNPYELPSRHLQAIGLACACYAQTEDHIQMAIAGCLGVDTELGWAVTTHMPTPLRESVLKSVAEIKLDSLDDLDRLDDLIAQFKEAATKRNAIAHHLWARDEKTGEIFTVKTDSRTRLEVDLVPMPIDKIESEAAFIYKAGMEILRFLLEKGLIPAPPPTDRPRFHKNKTLRKKRRKSGLGAS